MMTRLEMSTGHALQLHSEMLKPYSSPALPFAVLQLLLDSEE